MSISLVNWLMLVPAYRLNHSIVILPTFKLVWRKNCKTEHSSNIREFIAVHLNKQNLLLLNCRRRRLASYRVPRRTTRRLPDSIRMSLFVSTFPEILWISLPCNRASSAAAGCSLGWMNVLSCVCRRRRWRWVVFLNRLTSSCLSQQVVAVYAAAHSFTWLLCPQFIRQTYVAN